MCNEARKGWALVWHMQGEIDWMAEAARHERKRQRRDAEPAIGAQRLARALGGGEVATMLTGDQAQALSDLEALLADIVDEGDSATDNEGEPTDMIDPPMGMPSQSALEQQHPAPAAGSSSDASSPGVLEGERLHAVRLACISDCVGWSTEEICRRLGFDKAENPWRLVQRGPPSGGWDVEGAALGRLTVTFGGKTLQAVCSNPGHSHRCKFLLNVRGDVLATEARLLRWLISGVAVSRDEHMKRRDVIKAEHTAKS